MRRLGSESGLTLIEVAITILVLTTGCLATLATMSQFSKAASNAQTHAVVVSVAQREIEALRPIPYAKLGLTAAPGTPAATEAPLLAPAASETLVVGGGGIVDPGGTAFSVNGVRGRIYRYVTRRTQPGPAINARVTTELSGTLGADVSAAIGDLCPGSVNSKRLVVAVVPVDPSGNVGRPVRVSTVAADPKAALPAAANYAGLKVQSVVAGVTTPATSTATPMTTQAFNLFDTRCDASTPAAATDHSTRDTSENGATCPSGGSRPDLMGLAAIPGATSDPVHDYSTDLIRPAAGGRVLMRDDRAGSCTASSSVSYASSEASIRKRSLHTWATAPSAAAFEIPPSGARGTVTLWTATATGTEGPARLCVVVRRSSNGDVLGSTDYSLPAWPSELTQLTMAFDLSGATLAAGERLLLTVRVPSDSGRDLQVVYAHPSRASNMTITTTTGKEFH
jgi:hypothetical protein